MAISKKSINNISMYQPDFLNCVEKIIEKIKFIKCDQNLNQILNGYFFKDGVEGICVQREPGIKILFIISLRYTSYCC
jgi:hypothetical protein